MRNIYFLLIIVHIIITSQFLYAEITASVRFDKVIERYDTIYDYSLNIHISNIDNNTAKNSVLYGRMLYKAPDMLRINFTSPKDQVLLVTKDKMLLYVPQLNVNLTQTLNTPKLQEKNPSGIATKAGLLLLKYNYSVSYTDGFGLSNLGNGSSEQVYKLTFRWRNHNEGFREIQMAITPSNFIRQIIGKTSDYRIVTITFSDYNINVNLSEQDFEYNTPPTANTFNNFLSN